MAGRLHSEAITSHTSGQGLKFCRSLAFKPANVGPEAYEGELRGKGSLATCEGAKTFRKQSGTL